MAPPEGTRQAAAEWARRRRESAESQPRSVSAAAVGSTEPDAAAPIHIEDTANVPGQVLPADGEQGGAEGGVDSGDGTGEGVAEGGTAKHESPRSGRPAAASPRGKERKAAQGEPSCDEGFSFAYGPANFGFCYVSLEEREGLNLQRIRVDGRKVGFSDESLRDALAAMEEIMERRVPVTVTYDVRNVPTPSMKHVREGLKWAGEHKELLDEYIQGITVILNSWVLTKLANFVLSVLKPPQPTKICRDEAEAIAFLWAKCQTARSWGGSGKDAPRRGKTASTVRASPEGVGVGV